MLSSKFQISATVIKLMPILIIAIVGLFAGMIVGDEFGLINGFTNSAEGYAVNFGDAVKKTAFAYEGWVCATTINAELKESKKKSTLFRNVTRLLKARWKYFYILAFR